MVFQFTASSHFDFITQFANQIDVPVQNNFMEIPQSLGEGFVRKVTFGENFRLLVHRYTLKEDLIIRRNPASGINDLRSIFFYNNRQDIDLRYNLKGRIPFSRDRDSAVQLTTNDLSSIIKFPAQRAIQYVVIGITASKLKSFLSIDNSNSTLRTLTTENASFLILESMDSEMKQLLKNIADTDLNAALGHFYLQIKVQELLYLLMYKLNKRGNTSYKRINSADAEKLILIRNQILGDLSTPPVLKQLAQIATMSPTKLKQLFKQSFGDSIYSYFQKARMEEAAFLLRQAGYTVSQTGYELGFSNLSHFSRLFKKHYGMTPKKYTNVG